MTHSFSQSRHIKNLPRARTSLGAAKTTVSNPDKVPVLQILDYSEGIQVPHKETSTWTDTFWWRMLWWKLTTRWERIISAGGLLPNEVTLSRNWKATKGPVIWKTGARQQTWGIGQKSCSKMTSAWKVQGMPCRTVSRGRASIGTWGQR